MRVLGIDPGLAKTGWAVIELEEKEPRAVAYDVITTSRREATSQRLKKIFHKIREIATQYQPDAAAIESLFFSSNLKTAVKVAQSQGAVLVALAAIGPKPIEVFEYTPLRVKQAVTGYGKASKFQVKQMVTSLLHLTPPPRSDHCADALALALCHLYASRFNNYLKPASGINQAVHTSEKKSR